MVQKLTKQDVQVLDVKPLYKGFFKMHKYRFVHKLHNGGWSEPVEREIFERGHAVAVLPYDPVLNKFVLIEQIRIGALETSHSPWLLEVIAGMIDEGESPEEVCIREAHEEAGIHITDLHPALSYMASPGGTTERIQVFMGKVDASQAEGVFGLDYENEDILVHSVEETQAFEWLEQGRIDNSATVIALQWFALNKQRLLQIWSGVDRG